MNTNWIQSAQTETPFCVWFIGRDDSRHFRTIRCLLGLMAEAPFPIGARLFAQSNPVRCRSVMQLKGCHMHSTCDFALPHSLSSTFFHADCMINTYLFKSINIYVCPSAVSFGSALHASHLFHRRSLSRRCLLHCEYFGLASTRNHLLLTYILCWPPRAPPSLSVSYRARFSASRSVLSLFIHLFESLIHTAAGNVIMEIAVIHINWLIYTSCYCDRFGRSITYTERRQSSRELATETNCTKHKVEETERRRKSKSLMKLWNMLTCKNVSPGSEYSHYRGEVCRSVVWIRFAPFRKRVRFQAIILKANNIKTCPFSMHK